MMSREFDEPYEPHVCTFWCKFWCFFNLHRWEYPGGGCECCHKPDKLAEKIFGGRP